MNAERKQVAFGTVDMVTRIKWQTTMEIGIIMNTMAHGTMVISSKMQPQ